MLNEMMSMFPIITPMSMQSAIDKVVDEFGEKTIYPRIWPMDVEEADGKYVVDVEIPGADKNDINVMVNNDNLLVIEYEHTEEEKGERSFIMHERSEKVGFKRRIKLEKQVVPSQATSSYSNGILHIEIPKSEEIEETSHRIEIG